MTKQNENKINESADKITKFILNLFSGPNKKGLSNLLDSENDRIAKLLDTEDEKLIPKIIQKGLIKAMSQGATIFNLQNFFNSYSSYKNIEDLDTILVFTLFDSLRNQLPKEKIENLFRAINNSFPAEQKDFIAQQTISLLERSDMSEWKQNFTKIIENSEKPITTLLYK